MELNILHLVVLVIAFALEGGLKGVKITVEFSTHAGEGGLLVDDADITKLSDVEICGEGDRSGLREEPEPG